jgi:hypothetical protein
MNKLTEAAALLQQLRQQASDAWALADSASAETQAAAEAYTAARFAFGQAKNDERAARQAALTKSFLLSQTAPSYFVYPVEVAALASREAAAEALYQATSPDTQLAEAQSFYEACQELVSMRQEDATFRNTVVRMDWEKQNLASEALRIAAVSHHEATNAWSEIYAAARAACDAEAEAWAIALNAEMDFEMELDQSDNVSKAWRRVCAVIARNADFGVREPWVRELQDEVARVDRSFSRHDACEAWSRSCGGIARRTHALEEKAWAVRAARAEVWESAMIEARASALFDVHEEAASVAQIALQEAKNERSEALNALRRAERDAEARAR